LIDEDAEAEKIFQIVGETGADVKGATSPSPRRLRALIGKKVGDSVEVNTPGGGRSYEILKVDYI
jgi:transcription elongation factor GreA